MKHQNTVAVIQFPLRNFPSPEILELVDKLFWEEYIYGVNLKFNAESDEGKYVMSIKSPSHLIKEVFYKVNEIILKGVTPADG